MGQEHVEASRSSSAAVWSVTQPIPLQSQLIFILGIIEKITTKTYTTMAQKQLSEMTTEELNKNLKLMRVAIAVISASIGVMIVSAFLNYSKKGFTVFTVLPLMFVPILTMNIANMKKIKAELLSRK